MRYRRPLALAVAVLFSAKQAAAHCPLCTAGAGVAAAGAAYLGVDTAIIGLFIGAFGVSTGWWMSRKLDTQYVPHQTVMIVTASFLLTVVPVLPIISSVVGVPIFLTGEYGSLLNRTYLLDRSLITAGIGGLVVACTPRISRAITQYRGRVMPFQGIALTFVILLTLSGMVQVM